MRSRMRRFFRKSNAELIHLNKETVDSSNVLSLENNDESDESLKEQKLTKTPLNADDKTTNLITTTNEENIEKKSPKDLIKIDKGKSEKMGVKEENISNSFLKRFNSHKAIANSLAKVEAKIDATNKKPGDVDYTEQLYQQAKINEINISEISGSELGKPCNKTQPVTSTSFDKAAGDDDVVLSSDAQREVQTPDKTIPLDQKSNSPHPQSSFQQQNSLDKLEVCIEKSPQRFSPFFAALKSNGSSSRVVAANVTPRPYLSSK